MSTNTTSSGWVKGLSGYYGCQLPSHPRWVPCFNRHRTAGRILCWAVVIKVPDALYRRIERWASDSQLYCTSRGAAQGTFVRLGARPTVEFWSRSNHRSFRSIV